MDRPLSHLVTRLAYGARQLPRVAWYVGHSLALRRLAETARRQEGQKARRRPRTDLPVPDRNKIYADMAALFLQDLANVEAKPSLQSRLWNLDFAELGQPAAERQCRHDLEDLRAAIEHHAKEGLHRGVVRVTLPPKGAARDRWLTRDELAAVLWACWRHREVQTLYRGKRKGERRETEKRPLRHLARFILLAVYSGSRAGAVLTASPARGEGRSHIDLARGIFYRLAEGARATNKRQPPVPLPRRLLAHLRRWVAKGVVSEYFVEWNGKPVKSVKTAFKTALRLAKVSGQISPHTLRHTAATWLMQNGVDKWEAAGFLGMSVEMLDRVYGHHHPDHLRRAALSLGYRRGQSLAVPLAALRPPRASVKQGIENAGGGRSHSRTCLRRQIPC
jgi:integrase